MSGFSPDPPADAPSSLELDLWHVFTYYSVSGDALDPGHMKISKFIQMCRDCEFLRRDIRVDQDDIGISDFAASVSQITTPELELLVTACKRRLSSGARVAGHSAPTSSVLTYAEFVTLLALMSPRLLPEEPPELVFHMVVTTLLLPAASRREPSMPLGAHDPGGAAAQLLDARLSRGLRRIYDHYAERSDKIRRHAVATETRARIKAGVQKLGSAGTTRAEMGDVHGKVCFAVFYQFATEYSMLHLVTTVQVTEVFLAAVPGFSGDCLRAMGWKEFVDAVVRLALVSATNTTQGSPAANDDGGGGDDHSDSDLSESGPGGNASVASSVAAAAPGGRVVTPLDQTKGLLLYMFRATSSAATAATRFKSKDAESLAASVNYGSDHNERNSVFHRQFYEMWKEDDLRDYLAPWDDKEESALEELDKLVGGLIRSRRDTIRESGVFSAPEPHSGVRAVVRLELDELDAVIARRPDVADFIANAIEEMKTSRGAHDTGSSLVRGPDEELARPMSRASPRR